MSEFFTYGSVGGGSSRQGCNLAGESPAVSIARVGHVAIPHPGEVTNQATRGVNGPAALKTQSFQRWVQPGGLASMGA